MIGQNRAKRANFQGSPLFSSYVQHKTINLLSLCQFDAGMLAEGKGHETHVYVIRDFSTEVCCFLSLFHVSCLPPSFYDLSGVETQSIRTSNGGGRSPRNWRE